MISSFLANSGVSVCTCMPSFSSRGVCPSVFSSSGPCLEIAGLFGEADFQLDPLAVAKDGQRMVMADLGLLDDRLEFLGRGNRLAGELRR